MLVGGLAPQLPCPPRNIPTCTVVGRDDAEGDVWSQVINGAGF